VTDECGNISFRDQTITVRDTIKPTFVVFPADTTITHMSDTTDVVKTISGSDNCTFAANLFFSYNDFSDGATITRTWSVTDECGNIFTRNQVIMVKAPTTLLNIAYPNPSKNGKFSIAYDAEAVLSIKAANGQTVFNTTIVSGVNEIEANLSAGIYFIIITEKENRQKTGKLIVP
jgi:hypothetical protein